MRNSLALLAGALLCGGLLAACESQPTQSEREFGDSVRQMVAAQKAPPAATAVAPAGGLDGRKAEAIMKVYREDVSQPKQIHNEIKINVGN